MEVVVGRGFGTRHPAPIMMPSVPGHGQGFLTIHELFVSMFDGLLGVYEVFLLHFGLASHTQCSAHVFDEILAPEKHLTTGFSQGRPSCTPTLRHVGYIVVLEVVTRNLTRLWLLGLSLPSV